MQWRGGGIPQTTNWANERVVGRRRQNLNLESPIGLLGAEGNQPALHINVTVSGEGVHIMGSPRAARTI